MKALTTEMQVALKSLPQFNTKTLKELVEETSRLEIAGVKSKVVSPDLVANVEVAWAADMEAVINSITDFATKSMQEFAIGKSRTEQSVNSDDNGTEIGAIRKENVNPVDAVSTRGKRGGGARRSNNGRNDNFKCRSCKKSGHGYRRCTERFCQACGKRGHDAWDTQCPNYDA